MTLHPRNPQDLDRVEKIVAQLREAWKDDPNVVHIAAGLKISGGFARPGALVVTFFVHEKLPADEIQRRGLRLVPPEVEGIPTDVEPTRVRPLAGLPTRRARRDPLLGGVAVGNGNYQWHWGTLAGIVFDETSGVEKGLTNEHVLVFTNEGQAGDPVIQPALPRVEDYIDIDFGNKCCPVGALWFIKTGGPISATLGWLAAMAGIVALSDTRDPTRRGQDATLPAPGERTLREQVDVTLEYPDFPIPGTPYKVDVNWNYTRVTTGQPYTHSVTETQTNSHVLNLQRLVTDRKIYQPGATVHLLATLSSPEKWRCNAFHAIAYLMPAAQGQQDRSHMVVLHPISGAVLKSLRHLFPELSEKPNSPLICVDLAGVPPDILLPSLYRHRHLVYENLHPQIPMRTVDMLPAGAPDGLSELFFSAMGVRIRLPHPSDAVTAMVAQFTDAPVKIQAFDASGNLVGSYTAPNVGAMEHHLEIRAPGIVEVIVSGGGGEGILRQICFSRELETDRCYYYARVQLDPLDPLGSWNTHLFAQTVNDVGAKTAPELAAQIIGGLPVTRNFEYLGEGSVPPYGKGCIFQPSIDGDFEVVP